MFFPALVQFLPRMAVSFKAESQSQNTVSQNQKHNWPLKHVTSKPAIDNPELSMITPTPSPSSPASSGRSLLKRHRNPMGSQLSL